MTASRLSQPRLTWSLAWGATRAHIEFDKKDDDSHSRRPPFRVRIRSLDFRNIGLVARNRPSVSDSDVSNPKVNAVSQPANAVFAVGYCVHHILKVKQMRKRGLEIGEGRWSSIRGHWRFVWVLINGGDVLAGTVRCCVSSARCV